MWAFTLQCLLSIPNRQRLVNRIDKIVFKVMFFRLKFRK